MPSCIAILTYNRLPVLQTFLRSIARHMPGVPVAVFDDGSTDGTLEWLASGTASYAAEFKAQVFDTEALPETETALGYPKMRVFAGSNLGVAGNSNRALRWFLSQTDCDHLLLCNDDMVATGDFSKIYAEAHARTDIGLFCWCDLGKGYETIPHVYAGVEIRLLTRLTGCLMSITRKLVENIGYFDPEFGKAGEEHCAYTYRAMLAGFQHVDGIGRAGIDVDGAPASLQAVSSSIDAAKKQEYDAHSQAVMRVEAARYGVESPFRPYRLRSVTVVGGRGSDGIPAKHVSAAFVHGDSGSFAW